MKKLIEYIEQGHTLRETGEKFGFEYKEMRDFKARYNKNQKEDHEKTEVNYRRVYSS